MSQELIVIQLAAILVATSYDNSKSIIKWGGLIVAVGTYLSQLIIEKKYKQRGMEAKID